MFGCRTRLLMTPKRVCNILLGGFNRVGQLVPQSTRNLAKTMIIKVMGRELGRVCQPSFDDAFLLMFRTSNA